VSAADSQGTNGWATKAAALAGRLAEIDTLVKAWQAKMDNPSIVDAVAAKLTELNDRRKQVAGELALAQREAASPVAEAWGSFRTLAGLDPDADTDDLRTRIKGALRRAVGSIHCLFVGRGRAAERLAAVQVHFKSGAVRSYLIASRQGRGNSHGYRAEGCSRVWSLDAVLGPGDLDLRDRTHALELEEALQALDVNESGK
jgi:hypothetical protein